MINMVYLPNSPLSSAAEGFRRFLSGHPGKRKKAVDLHTLPAGRTGKQKMKGKRLRVKG